MTTPVDVIRSWIYTAADDAAGVAAAIASQVDAVILDLEDLVPTRQKAAARIAAVATIKKRHSERWPRIYVRINHTSSGTLDEDLDVAVREGVAGIRYPKAEDPEDLQLVSARIAALERDRGLAGGSIRIVANIESALGVLRATAILEAERRVERFGFGEADFSRDVGARVGPAKQETFVARSMIVLASRAAGRAAPCDGAHLDRSDMDGLRASTIAGRDLGFFGRTAVAIEQVAVVNDVYTPDGTQIAWARAVLVVQAAAEESGRGSAWLSDGTFVDIAIVRTARDVLRRLEDLGDRGRARIRP